MIEKKHQCSEEMALGLCNKSCCVAIGLKIPGPNDEYLAYMLTSKEETAQLILELQALLYQQVDPKGKEVVKIIQSTY